MHSTIPCNNLSTFSSTTFGRSVELKSEKEMQAMHCEEKHDDAGLGLNSSLPLKRPDGWKSEKAAHLSNVRWMSNSANKASWEPGWSGCLIWMILDPQQVSTWLSFISGLSRIILSHIVAGNLTSFLHMDCWNSFAPCSYSRATLTTFADWIWQSLIGELWQAISIAASKNSFHLLYLCVCVSVNAHKMWNMLMYCHNHFGNLQVREIES